MQEYSGNIRLRLPVDLHARLAEIADGVGVSLNTLMVTLLAEGATRRANVERAAPANVAEAMAEAVLDSLTTPTRSGELMKQLDGTAPEWRMWIPPYRLVGLASEPSGSRSTREEADTVTNDSGRSVADKVVADLGEGRFEDVEAAVKVGARSTLNARAIEAVWSRAQQASGGYQGAGEPMVTALTGGDLYDYPLDFADSEAHLQVAVLSGEVAGLLLRPGRPTGQWNT